jgi:hypothetical protein
VFLSTPNTRHETSLVFRLALQFRNTQIPYRINPRLRTSPCCRCVRLRKSSWFPSTPKINLPIILLFRIVSVIHVISSQHHPISENYSQGSLYGFQPNPVKYHLTFLPVIIRYQFSPQLQLSCSVRPDVSLTSADVRPQVT